MCYSKEVQLSTGTIVLSFCLFYYFYFSIYFAAKRQTWLKPFLNNLIISFALIGAHQVLEALALWFNNQWIYKIGLIVSISAMYFLLRSLEHLTKRDLKSRLALGAVGAVALGILFRELSFSQYGAFVIHKNAFIWSVFWILLFAYFHICAFSSWKYLRADASRKNLLIYLLATIDFSLILSIIYSIYGYWRYAENVCTALPSIWCTFSVVQILILPLFLVRAPMILKQPETNTLQTIKQTILYLLIAFLVLLFTLFQLSQFHCLTYKFAFP